MSRVQLVIVPNWNVCNFYKLSALFRANNRNLSVCEFSYGNEMPRSDDLREEKQREMANTSLTECLLFGRAVDRLYLRSGLSLSLSWLRAQCLNGKEEATSHVEDVRVTQRSNCRYSQENLQSRTVHLLLSDIRLTYIAKFARNARRASTSTDTFDIGDEFDYPGRRVLS